MGTGRNGEDSTKTATHIKNGKAEGCLNISPTFQKSRSQISFIV